MSFAPNFFIDREPWLNISFGSGAPVRAALVEINDVSTEDEWKKQKSKETSGQVAVFGGTTWGDPKLVFEATDDRDFDDLRALWEFLAPVPGLTGTPTTAAAPGQTVAIGSPKASTGGTSTGSSGASTAGSTAASTSQADQAFQGKTQNVGPRPPTVPVTHPLLAYHGILAVARKKWEGPYVTDTNGLRVTLTLIADKPPKLAGTGAMKPADPGAQFAGGAGGNPGGTGGGASGGNATGTPPSLNKSAAAGAAGT